MRQRTIVGLLELGLVRKVGHVGGVRIGKEAGQADGKGQRIEQSTRSSRRLFMSSRSWGSGQKGMHSSSRGRASQGASRRGEAWESAIEAVEATAARRGWLPLANTEASWRRARLEPRDQMRDDGGRLRFGAPRGRRRCR